MKWITRVFLLVCCVGLFADSYAQEIPQGIYYQAVARSENGNELTEYLLGIRINILDETDIVYTELHSAVTDQFGLFELVIGGGNVEQGTFSGINWSSGNHFLNVELDLGDGFIDISTTQLLSVPYSLYAERAASVDNTDDADANPSNELIESFSVVGNNLVLTDAGNTYIVPLSSIAEDDGDWTISSNTGIPILIAPGFNVGIRTTNPTSTLSVDGSLSLGVRTIESNASQTVETSVGIEHSQVLCDVVNGSITVSLPSASQCRGRTYIFKRYDSSSTNYSADSNNVASLIPATGETIDNKTELILDGNVFEQLALLSDGQNWFITSYSNNP